MGSITAAISSQLPYLRRYVRAVSGSQTSGDALVALLLQALTRDVSLFPVASNERVSLYKAFAAACAAHDPTAAPDKSQPDWEQKAAANLAQLTTLQRQAFLLVSVEGFSPEEGAEVLNVADEDFDRLLTEASEELSRQLATDVMIIEDELMIAMDLEQIVESLGHRVVGVARTHIEAQALYDKEKPRLILADIQLADGSSGIQAVNDIVSKRQRRSFSLPPFPNGC